jgi:hypothetical protein
MRRVLDVLPEVDPSPRTTPSHLPPQYEPLPPQHPSAYPPTFQHIPVSGRPPPAFPIPQITHAPTTRLDPQPMPPRGSNTHSGPPPVPPRAYSTHLDPPPPRVNRSITMPAPGLPHDTHVAPGPYLSYAPQAPSISQSRSHSGISGASQIPTDRQGYRDDYVEDWVDHDISGTQGGSPLAKGPPNPPVAGMQKKKQGNHKKPPPNRTQTAPVPGPIFRCRRCLASITGEIAARFSGFCCDSHMWAAIHDRTAMLCPGCKVRACPEGRTYCSAECANRQQFPRH